MNVATVGYCCLWNVDPNPQKKIRVLSQVLVKIFNFENHIFQGSGQFDEDTNSIGSKLCIAPVKK